MNISSKSVVLVGNAAISLVEIVLTGAVLERVESDLAHVKDMFPAYNGPRGEIDAQPEMWGLV